MFEWITPYEQNLLQALQNLRCPALDFFLQALTTSGNAGMVWILWTFILLVLFQKRRLALTLGLALGIGFVITNICLKPLIFRPRPLTLLPSEIFSLLPIHPKDPFSFPSGHSCAGFAFATAMQCHPDPHRIQRVLAWCLGLLIAFSRLYFYLHYPTDVLAGIVIGVTSALIACFIMRRMEQKSPQRPFDRNEGLDR